jgi:hypothetical protein
MDNITNLDRVTSTSIVVLPPYLVQNALRELAEYVFDLELRIEELEKGKPFCPQCKSDTEQTTGWVADRMRDWNKAHCSNCGWEGEAWECVNKTCACVDEQ